MSLFTDGMTKMFPLEFIKQCVETYTKEHGQAPKILVLSNEDYLDFHLNCTLGQAGQLGLKVTHAAYLKSGELDLAMGVKEE